MKVYISKKSKIELDRFKKILDKYKIQITERYIEADFILVLGGDGTTLKIVKYIVEKNIPILVVNFGKLGYLSSILPEEFEKAIIKIKKKQYYLNKKRLLEIDVDSKRYYALNELCIAKSNIDSKIVDVLAYDVSETKEYINKFRGDGVILSTPTGTTAYALSVGGPLIHNINAMLLISIAPQTINSKPLILSGNKKILFCLDKNSRDSSLHIDGNKHIPLNNKIKIVATMSKKTMNFITFKKENYYEILREKMKWGISLI